MINDPYLKPAYGTGNRLRRFCWSVIWTTLYRLSPRPLFGWRAFLLRCFGAKITQPSFFYPRAKIWAPWLLQAEQVVTVADGVDVYNPGGVLLKHHVIVSQDAFLCGATHDFNSSEFNLTSRRIVIEPYGWICARAIVLPGVVIGEGAVLGAGAVTGKTLDPWSVYAGNPARKVGERKRFLEAESLLPKEAGY